MRKIFLAVAFLPFVLTALLQTNGAFASDYDWKTTNCPISPISGSTTSVPYQFIEILDNATGQFRMNFNFSSGNYPQVRKK
jgi:hypothetical protein